MKTIAAALLIVLALSAAPVFAADAPSAATTKSIPNQIAISEYMFAPATLTVAAGTKVTWVNHDQVPHTIVESAVNKTFRSSALDTDDSYSFTFAKPGVYHYFCTLHPQMVGTVNVTAAK
jgi:plastocyanin